MQREKRNAWEGVMEKIGRRITLGRHGCGVNCCSKIYLKATGIETCGLD